MGEQFDLERKKCVAATEKGGSYDANSQGMPFKLKCRVLPFHAFEIISDPPGKAYLGVEDSTKQKVDREEMSLVKRMIRHQDSYLGGAGYGDRGGYDITLIEMVTPIKGYKPACLPSPKFDDIKEGKAESALAGYGKYHRSSGKTCQTNTFGQVKYHYCDKSEAVGSDACDTNTPAPSNKACTRFFDDVSTPDAPPGNTEEIRLKMPKGDVLCYPAKNPENPEFGWCKTKGNYYNKDSTDESEEGWGFCSSECFQDLKESDGGVLR